MDLSSYSYLIRNRKEIKYVAKGSVQHKPSNKNHEAGSSKQSIDLRHKACILC